MANRNSWSKVLAVYRKKMQRDVVHSPSLTWNLKMMMSNRNLLFQGLIFRFHVKLQGCTTGTESMAIIALSTLKPMKMQKSMYSITYIPIPKEPPNSWLQSMRLPKIFEPPKWGVNEQVPSGKLYMAMENGPFWRCIPYQKTGFQPAMLVYWSVSWVVVFVGLL